MHIISGEGIIYTMDNISFGLLMLVLVLIGYYLLLNKFSQYSIVKLYKVPRIKAKGGHNLGFIFPISAKHSRQTVINNK